MRVCVCIAVLYLPCIVVIARVYRYFGLHCRQRVRFGKNGGFFFLNTYWSVIVYLRVKKWKVNSLKYDRF